jgi:alanine-synthesizing transaminase
VKPAARTAVPPEPSPEHVVLAELRARFADAIDLCTSNPTEVGLVHPPEVYAALGDARAARYEPEPFGLRPARAAIVDHYARRGVAVDRDRVWLTASTSEAYAQLMLLTADPGDVWWVPQPGYPLFDALARPLGVELRPYPLHFEGRWHVGVEELAAAVAGEPRSRAIVAVAPGNPTGAYLATTEVDALAELCEAQGIALVVDEVFADHEVERPRDRMRHVGGPLPCATFVLSGLSKVAALPQMKLGWVVAHGPVAEVAPVLARAEHLADAFLSVATPVQLALPTLLAAGDALRPTLVERVRTNLAALRNSRDRAPMDVLPVEGGWVAIVRLPALQDDLAWTRDLAEHAGVLVQPGYLYDLPSARIVVSLIAESARFARAVESIAARVAVRAS